jgi:DNA-binding FadR family transcriptional regulator
MPDSKTPGMSAAVRRSILQPLDERGRAEVVAVRLREAISMGVLADGEQLPSEVDLSTEIGVSTKTLREALAALRQEGLIETRRGRNGGSFIRRPKGMTHSHASERLMVLSTSQLRDLADFQRAISGSAAMLAASRADDDQIERLRHLAVQSGQGLAEHGKNDSRFHIEIAVVSQSEHLTQTEVAIQSEIRDLLWVLAFGPEDVPTVAAQHLAIWQAIAEQRGADARSLAEEHVTFNLRRLEELQLRLRRS